MTYLEQTFKTIIDCPFIDFTKLVELYCKGQKFEDYPFISSAIQQNLHALNAAVAKDKAVYEFKYYRKLSDDRLVEIAKILNVYDEFKTINELYDIIDESLYPVCNHDGLQFLASVAVNLGNMIGIRN